MSDRFTFHPLAPASRPSGRPDVSEIRPHLVIGEYPTPEDADWLKTSLGISAVVCLQDDVDLHFKFLRDADLRRAYDGSGIEFHRVPIADGNASALAAALDDIVDLVQRLITQGNRVYVHCNAGMNRAPTVAIAYLHVHEGLSLDAARDAVKERRLCVPYMTVLAARYAPG
jgi:protein-tyrosine phosphatase